MPTLRMLTVPRGEERIFGDAVIDKARHQAGSIVLFWPVNRPR